MEPLILYKHLPPSRIDVLENQCFAFTQNERVNDPFEFTIPDVIQSMSKKDLEALRKKPSIIEIDPEILSMAIDSTEESRFQSIIPDMEDMLRHYGMFCLNSNVKDLLMWAHYAESHKGFALEIGFQRNYNIGTCAFNNGETLFKDIDNETFFEPKEVTYTSVRPRVLVSELNQFYQDQLLEIDLANKLFYSKSLEWHYEGEHRFVVDLRKYPNNFDSDKKVYLFKYNSSWIRAIYLGARIEDPVKDKILDILKNNEDFSHVKIYKCTLCGKKYKLKFEEVKR